MSEPLTDELLAHLDSLDCHTMFITTGQVRLLAAEVRRLRAERAEVAGLIDRATDAICLGVSTGIIPEWQRLCELFPELKETP